MPEYIFCSVWEGNSTPTLVVLVYRPPDVPIRADRHLFKLIHSHNVDFSHRIVIGDWNADMLDTKDSDTKFLSSPMNDLSLKLVQTGSTHHTRFKESWIDSIFVDNCDNIISSDCLSCLSKWSQNSHCHD